MLSEMQRQFVEVAARTIHERTPVPDHWRGREETWSALHAHTAADKVDNEHACYLLGRLEGVNGTTIEVLVKGAQVERALVCENVEAPTGETCPRCKLDADAFFRAITLQALGLGDAGPTYGMDFKVRVFKFK